MDHHTAAAFGKRQEYRAIAELLARGFDVYMTLVDDQQIDCVIRQEKNGRLRYLDVQIKARSKGAKQGATFAALSVRKPRRNFWFIFYSEASDSYWVMPSLAFVKESNENKGGPTGHGHNKGKHYIKFENHTKSQGWKPRPRFEQYQDNFDALKW